MLVFLCLCLALLELNSVRSHVVCDYSPVKLSCPARFVIKVTSAFYGRDGRSHCGLVETRVTTCSAPHAKLWLQKHCDGRQSCSTTAPHHLLGDPCHGVRKFLDFNYECVKGHSVVVCGYNRVLLSCPPGSMVVVKSAFYGRGGKPYCSASRAKKCAIPAATTIMKAICDDKLSCEASAPHHVLGDPCHGVAKYLEVQYACVPGCRPLHGESHFETYEKSAYACDYERVDLSCPSGMEIQILSAFYGRDGKPFCGNSHVTNCSAKDARRRLQLYCHGKSSCGAGSPHYILGDPCHGVRKYMEVHYTCKWG